MTLEEALGFLDEHSPMPSDDDLSDELIGQYDDVRKFLEKNPDPRAIRPLLFSFGDGSGFGVYQLVEDVLRKFPPELVLPHLQDALRSPGYGIRYWGFQIAQLFPDNSLTALAVANLSDEDGDIRTAAASALGSIGDPAAVPMLEAAAAAETDESARGAMADALADLRNHER